MSYTGIDTDTASTEHLVGVLDIAAYDQGLCHGRRDFEGSKSYAQMAERARQELERRLGGQEIKALTDERATLEAEARRLHGRVKSLTHNVDHQKERIRKLTEERDDARAERDRLRAATPRTTRPADVQTGQSVAWFSVEDMKWRVKRIKSGPDAAGFSISQMFNPHQKVVILGEPPRELDQDEGGDEADEDDSAHQSAPDAPVPDEAGAVIEAVEFNRAPMVPQLARKLGRQERQPFWWSLVSGDTWPDGYDVAYPAEITGWRWPAEGGDDQ